MSAPNIGVFDELLEVCMPWRGGVFAVLRAYVDGSQQGDGSYCVASMAYGRDSAKKAEREWRKLMGDRVAHLTDMHARKRDFEDMTAEEACEMLKSQVAIITKYASFGVVVSCDLNEIREFLPKTSLGHTAPILDGYRHAYALCANHVLHGLGRRATGGIAYTFELGDDHQSEQKKFLEYALSRPVLKKAYQCRSYSYLEKADSRLLETADVLAWEWAKELARQKEGKPMRPSLDALIKGNRKAGGFAHLHFTGEPLKIYMQRMQQMLLANSVEEIKSIISFFSSESANLTS